MTYIRVSLQGTTASTPEVWSINPTFNCSNPISPTQEEIQNAATTVAKITPGMPLQGMASARMKLAKVRVEVRSDAHALQGLAEAPYTGGWTSTTDANRPAQCAVVLSLRSDRPGATGRGRLYWPALGTSLVTTTLRLAAADVTAVSQAAVVYMTNIQDALRGALMPSPAALGTIRLCVVSRRSGTRTDINRIQVGDVIDTQRRRRDALPEVYHSVAYPAA